MGKIEKNEQPHVVMHAGRTSISDVIVMLELRHHVASFMDYPVLFKYKNEVFSGKQENVSHF